MRYENAINLAARRDFLRAEIEEQVEYCNERDREEQALIAQLQIAKQEIEDTGKLSYETKQRILAMDPYLKGSWAELETLSVKRTQELCARKKSGQLTPQQLSWMRDLYTVTGLIAVVGSLSQQRVTRVSEIALGRHAIPNNDALDRILRYETTIERLLSRSFEQLERLQRRRGGEMIPPPLSLHLT